MIERRTTDATLGSLPGAGTVVDARMSLGLWLRAGRAEKKLSLDDVARTTKIQVRILERIEAGTLDGLPADVFVRGFIRSFAKCCGLDEVEALKRYTAATQETRPSTVEVPPAARAMADLMAPAEIAEPIAAPPVEVEIKAEPIEAPKPTSSKKKNRKSKRTRRQAKRIATGTPAEPTPVVAAPPEPEPVVEVAAAAPPIDPELAPVDQLDPLVEPPADVVEDVIVTETWQPKMPPVTTTASVPWRRPAYVQTTLPAVPSLVIDDADPESAEQVLEDREAAKSVLTNAQRRSFLPPILLDREDRSARQGGLTLAVIILLIAATLTLSYLMRRPSSSGDGVTQATPETLLIG